MAEKSMTPRTDAQQFDSRYRNTQAKVVYALFARTLERENASLIAALELALPRIAHGAQCGAVRPTEEWAQHGSMSWENCNCERKVVIAALDQSKRTEAGK